MDGAVGSNERVEATAPTRILAVGNMYPPHHVGGYELMWQAAMRRARALGHSVRVLTTDYRLATSDQEEDPDVHRTLRWYWDLDAYAFPRLGPADRLSTERHNAVALRRHLDDFRPDVVAWWSMGCMSLALIEQVRRAGIAAVFVVHDDWLVYGRHHDQWLRMWRGWRTVLAPMTERLTGIPTRIELDGAGPFVFNSRYTLEQARGAGVTLGEASVVHPGIDSTFFSELPQRPWGWELAYVGRIDRQKGLDTAVRALARLPESANLTVWGSGDADYISEMEHLAAELGVADRVHFQGWADPERLRQAYASADAVVFPVRWEEPFGLVPLEAMAAGRPVVTTARGGTAEFVRDGENALVFDAEDDCALADAVARLGADEELRERLREGGRRTAAEYTSSRFAQRTVEEMVRAARFRRAST